jgi:hypothetical protein
MRADDDGFVSSPKRIMKMANAADDDMKVLIVKKYLIPFESGVCVIKDWKIHNYIQSDRYTETQYKEEKKLLSEKHGKYEVESECIQNVNRKDTQVRLELGKVRLDESVAEATKEFNFEEELIKLKESKRKDYKIIALYWKKKGFIFENQEQFNSALVRELKAAKLLKGYSGIQIGEAIKHCERKYNEWTLETTHKRISDVVNKK